MAKQNFLNINLYQINMFLIVCECGSFTMTSQILNTTQSAISKSIMSMETILGFPLFIRNNNKLELTSGGKLLAKEWRSVVQNMELSIDKAFLLYEREQRSIIIGEPDSMKTDKDYWPNIKIFQEDNKDISLSFVEHPISELIGKLVSNELDIIFTIDYEVPTLDRLGLNWKPVADSPFAHLILHQKHPLAAKDKISIYDLKNEDFIVPAPTLHQTYIDFMFELCKPYGFDPKLSITVPNARSMTSTLLRTHSGVILGNRFLYDADSPDLKHFILDNTYSRLIVAWKDSFQKPGVQDFIRAVTADYSRFLID